MKASRLLAGILIVAVGVALLLTNFDIVRLNWYYIIKLWPVLLVFAGISVLVPNEKWRSVLYAITAILLVIWLLSVASGRWDSVRDIFEAKGSAGDVQEFSVDMDKGVRSGELVLNTGAGTFSISDTTHDLISARTESNIGQYSLNNTKDGRDEKVDLSLQDKDHSWRLGANNTVSIRLNPDPEWRLKVNVGACSGNFDLTRYKVRSASFDAGVSKIFVRIGDRSDTTDLTLNTGASKLTVYVPESSGCQIDDQAQLSKTTFANFVNLGKGKYSTSNFDSAKKKIFVALDAGVSSIKVIRY